MVLLLSSASVVSGQTAVFRIPDTRMLVTDPVTVHVEMTNTVPVKGYAISLDYDEAVLELTEVSLPEELLDRTTVDLFAKNDLGDGYVIAQVVMNYEDPSLDELLGPGEDQKILKMDFTCIGPEQRDTEITFQDGLGYGPGVKNQVVILVEGVATGESPLLDDGMVTICPEADFEAAVEGCPPLDVSFENLSLGTWDSCSWFFGDTQNSTECDPIHRYDCPRSYQVTLELSREDGCVDSVTKEVVVPGPVAYRIREGPCVRSFHASMGGKGILLHQFTFDVEGGCPAWWTGVSVRFVELPRKPGSGEPYQLHELVERVVLYRDTDPSTCDLSRKRPPLENPVLVLEGDDLKVGGGVLDIEFQEEILGSQAYVVVGDFRDTGEASGVASLGIAPGWLGLAALVFLPILRRTRRTRVCLLVLTCLTLGSCGVGGGGGGGPAAPAQSVLGTVQVEVLEVRVTNSCGEPVPPGVGPGEDPPVPLKGPAITVYGP